MILLSCLPSRRPNVIRNCGFPWVCLCILCPATLSCCPSVQADAIKYAKPEFAQTNRVQNVLAVLPEVDKTFEEFAQTQHIPGWASPLTS